jgi:hypothetical protein
MSKPKIKRSLYQFGDQFARLEAVRAYVQAAHEIMAEAHTYENRNPDPTYVRKGITAGATTLAAATQIVAKLMSDMEGDLAVEGGKKNTILPPPLDAVSKPTSPEFKPIALDEPFGDSL